MTLNRRQFLSGALSTALLAALPGCGRRPATGKVRLTYNTFWTGLDAHTSVMDWMYRTFRKRHPDIEFEVVQSAGGAQDNGQKLMAELAAGGGPDVLHDTTYDHVRPGYCLDLTDHIAAWGDRFYSEALASCTWDGRVSSLPTEYSMVPCIWNTRLLHDVGEDVPATFEDYMRVGRALKKKGIALTATEVAGGHIFFSVLFGQADAVQAIALEEWESEPFRRAVEVLKEIRDAGFLPKNDIEMLFANGASLFQNDRLGHYMNGAWTLMNEITSLGVDPALRDRVAFAPFPAVDGARPIRAWVATKTALNAQIANDKPKLTAALAFLELFTSKEAAKLFISDAHSPEGVRYELTRQLAGPLLYAFMNSRTQATSVFTLPNNPGYFGEQSQSRALPDLFASLDEGATVKQALSVFAEVLRS